ncbi:MAG: cold shock domain-containing protein, partial [Desulfosalsimonadaceae bacterium]|nr:cold shock domain-containing protein [Desulfosalsimonadaceae bacterium]
KRTTDRGFGFINYNAIRKDLFFHAKELVGISFEDLRDGDKITFQMAEGPKGWVAVNVSRL